MAWVSGTYTKGNASTGGWTGDAASLIGIEAGRHDTQDNDFQDGINNCLTKDGQNTPTANLPMGGFKHTGVGNASANDQYTAWGQLRNGTPVYLDTANNRVGVGTTSPTHAVTILGADGPQSSIRNVRFSNDINASELILSKSRGATVNTNTVVQTGDNIGAINFAGADGSTFDNVGRIVTLAGTVTGGNIPGEMAFSTANSSGVLTERVRFNSTGNVGIGTTSPAYQLQLSTDSAAKPTTNTWTIASDERIKTNIQPYAKGLAEILQVVPITYDYNGKGGIAAGPGGVSIIAQELQPVFPECVGTFIANLNEDDAEPTELFNYNGHAITFALINAVKELSAKVEALEAQLAGS
jgi:hypothetical protein